MSNLMIGAGNGFDVGCDFTRLTVDVAVELAPAEHARPGYVIGYIAGDAASPLGFMRAARVRVHVRKSALISV